MDNPGHPVGFKSVQLTRDLLGVGSYGVVYKALCNQNLVCAAKVMHPVLINMEEEGKPEHLHRLPLQRFLKEIEILSSIRHPNIILYLGTSRDPDSNLPVLLTELMDESLTKFLERAHDPLPFRMEVKICHDVALALSFLHSNNIIHRDLSSNNVLMFGDRQAKVTDFGMATIFEDTQVQSATKNPGAAVYMPPEVKTSHPISCDKIDCFSLGVMCIQVMTRTFPDPTDRPQGIIGGILGFDQEVSRRQQHISMINKDHPLLPIALNCLKDNYKRRPDSSELCQLLGNVKNINYNNASPMKKRSVSMNELPCCDDDTPTDLSSSSSNPLFDKKTKVFKNLQHEKGKFNRPDLDPVKEHNFNNHDVHIHPISNQEMTRKEEPIPGLIEDDDEWVAPDISCFPAPEKPKKIRVSDKSQDFNTSWSLKATKAPQDIYRTADAVYLDVDGCSDRDGRIYMLCGPERRTIYSFHPVKYDWLQLQDTVLELSSLAVVGTFVVTVGGSKGLKCYNKLYSRVGYRWRERLPSMPTSRYNTIVASSGSHLIVAGGVGKNQTLLTTVEVLDMDQRQWSTAASLPGQAACFSGQVSGGKVWVLGYSNQVFSCWLDSLIQSGGRSRFSFTASTAVMPTVWSYDTIPVHATTLITIDDNLYAIGGKLSDTNKPTDAVYQYSSWNGRWYIVSHMTTVRSQCLAVGIPRKKLIVVLGGVSESGSPMKTVEMARLVRTADRFDSKSL